MPDCTLNKMGNRAGAGPLTRLAARRRAARTRAASFTFSRVAVLVVAAGAALACGSALATADARAEPLKAMWGPAVHDGQSLFPIYRELGVKILEEDLHWNEIAPHRPKLARNPHDPAYHWPASVIAEVAEAKRSEMQVALQLIGAPPWANGGKPARWAPEHPQDFANFAAAAARRFPSVHLWMIWGEPSRAKDFMPLTPARPFRKLDAAQRVAPHLYARILDASYEALKTVSRANVIIGGMTDTTADISTPQWIENMRLPDGKPPRLDLYGHNPFSARAPNLSNPPSPAEDIDFSDLARLSELVDRYLGRPANPKPGLFLSEWTIPTGVDQEFNFYVEPLVQARWITDGLRVAAELPDVYAVGWIHLYDEPPVTAGGLIEADGNKKPGYYAWRDG